MFKKNMFKRSRPRNTAWSPGEHSPHEYAHAEKGRNRRSCGRAAALLLAGAVFFAGCGSNAAASGNNTAASGNSAAGAEAGALTAAPDATQLAQTILDRSETVTSAEMDSTVRLGLSVGADGEVQEIHGVTKSTVRTILSPLTMHMVSSVDFSQDMPATDAEDPDGAQNQDTVPDGALVPDNAQLQNDAQTTGSEADSEQAPGGAGAGIVDPARETTLPAEENGGEVLPAGEAAPIDMETYGEITEDGRFATYTKSGDSWLKTVVAVPEASSDIFDTELLRSIVSGETEASVSPDTESVAGKDCYVLHTYLSGDYLQRTMETLSSTFSEIGIPLQDLPEDMLKDVRVETGYWVDSESGLPVKIEQDLSELGNTLFQVLFESLLSSPELSGGSATDAEQAAPAIQFSFSEYSSEILFNSFNTVTEITIPEEAREAEEISFTPGEAAQ